MIATIAAAPVTADAVDPTSGAAVLTVVAIGALLLAGVIVLRSMAAAGRRRRDRVHRWAAGTADDRRGHRDGRDARVRRGRPGVPAHRHPVRRDRAGDSGPALSPATGPVSGAARKVRAVPFQPPPPHPTGARPPAIPAELVPNHIALVMDGNGRWANARGLPRIEGHKRGEASLMDVARGCIDIGVRWLSAYAFSTENWRRSPDEVRFLMGFNRDVIRRRVDEMHAMGVRVRWAGRRPRLWRRVIRELEVAEEKTRDNDVLTLTMCVNYGGRAEIVDAVREIARQAAAGQIKPDKIDERTIARYLDEPRHARRRPVRAQLGRAAHVELPALAVRLRGDGLPGHAVPGLRPPPHLGGDRDLRAPGPPFRRRCSTRT